MAEVGKKSPWLKETSARSGFDNFDRFGKKKWRGIQQDGRTIAPDEYDTPPPSSRPLGGADISGSPRANSLTTDTPSSNNYTILYVTAAGGITLNSDPWLRVVGSNGVVNIASNPQITLGKAQQILAVQCVGSGVVLEDGDGLTLINGEAFSMTSGSVITFIMNRTDNTWYETSRTV